jgi:hypothetical protein
MKMLRVAGASFAAAFVGFAGIGNAGTGLQNLLITGTVDSVDVSSGAVVVSGQRVATSDAKRLVIGQTVSVFGQRFADGSIRNASIEAASQYVLASAPSAIDTKSRNDRLAGISGVGDRSEGISGVGSHSEGISGVGDRSEGISGVGSHSEGISGVGERSEGISGVGSHSEGISGVGDRSEGISGVGSHSEGISGVGDRSEGISGVGAQTE